MILYADELLRGLAAATQRQVGWKPYRQAVLLGRGLPVPAFFCVPRAAWDAWLAPHEDEVRRRLADLDLARDGAARLEDLRAWLRRQPPPAELVAELDAAARRLARPGERLAVRGSLVSRGAAGLDEDGACSLAGASVSLLDVVPPGAAGGASLADDLLEVWLSAWSLPAVVYRGAADPLGHSVAVQVQRQVAATRAFVAFTRDPARGADETVIASAWGGGEGIVQERVPIDHDFLSPAGEVLRRRPADSALAGSAAAGSADAPEPRAKQPPLDAYELRAVARLAREAERVFDAPQDVEGCFDAQGRAWLVQSRPLQAAPRVAVFDDSNVTESFPGGTLPLTYGFARRFYRAAFGDCLRRLGVPAARLSRVEPELERMIGYLDGRIYYRLDSFYELFDSHPLFPLYRGPWEETIGLRSSGRSEPLRARGALEVAGAVARLAWSYARHEPRLEELYAWFEGELAGARGPTAAPGALASLDRVEGFAARACERWGLTLVNDAFLILGHGLLGRLHARWGLREGLLNDLLTGDEGVTSAQVVQSAVALGELVQGDPALARACAERAPAALLVELEQGAFPAFGRALAAHLRRYGARGPEDLKLERPSPRERPEEVLAAVARYAAQGLRLRELRAREACVRDAAERELRAALSRARCALYERLLEVVRQGIRQRERARYLRSELFSACRALYLEAGARLVAEGALEHPDDVLWLTPEELSGAAAGTLVDDPRALVAGRRARAAAREVELAQDPLPARVEVAGAVSARRWSGVTPAADPGAGEDPAELRGLGSSAGCVRGRARVLTEPAPAGEDGVLVARETDPGWLYAMLGACALVVERGSLLSHTAIAGRKFGIPTVVGVPDATRRIPDGALIEVDGTRGRVRLLAG
ncbi:MAG: PEP/pyruvate-binding domain-containing protein [Planctomycetota bacterium]